MKLVGIFLVLYFIFTSGFIFEVTNSTATTKFDIPYSLNFSGDRTGIVGLFTTDDIKAAEWVAYSSNKDLMVATDYNSRALMAGYIPVVPRISKDVFTMPVFPNLEYFGNDFYFIRTDWMTRTGNYIEAKGIGLRRVHSLPSFEGYDLRIVFESGNTLVYEVSKCR